MSENAIYPVSAVWAANAMLNRARYEDMYARSLADPAGFWLEQASQVTGPWTPVTDSAPATIDTSTAQQFFRLRKP